MIDEACRWEHWVRPGTSWAEAFALNFWSPDIFLWPEETDAVPSMFAWVSPHLNDVASPQQLADRAASLKAIFDGALLIAIGSTYRPFDLGLPTASEPQDREWLLDFVSTADVRVEPFSDTYITQKVAKLRDPMIDPVARAIFLARYDHTTRAILKYTGVQGLSYMTLYAFRDWMKGADWDDNRIASEAGWSPSKLSDFTQTANNPAYLGPFCRHGGVKAAPKRPMPLNEAEDGMKRAMGKFLLHRADLLHLRDRWKLLAA